MDQSNAVVRAYAEAMQVAAFDPEQAAAKLEALLALYGQTDAQGAAERLPADNRTLAVQLAGKKLPRLREAAREQFRDDLTVLKRQLANADKLHRHGARAGAGHVGGDHRAVREEVLGARSCGPGPQAAGPGGQPEPQTVQAGP